MPNAWITHVKQFAADKKLSYGCALSMPECKNSYKKTKESNKIKESKEEEVKPEPKAYTMYKKPIGPVKPSAPPPKKSLDKATIKKMIEMSMKEMESSTKPAKKKK